MRRGSLALMGPDRFSTGRR
jgi:hypothetical protein